MMELIIGVLIVFYVGWIVFRRVRDLRRGNICDCSKCDRGCNKD